MSLRYFRFEALLLNDGWLSPAWVGVDQSGVIQLISSTPPNGVAVEAVYGYALPGLMNSHSHAFQYAMAGMAETPVAGHQDDFWGWREQMYKVALGIGPEQLESIATMLYTEMVRHGYTSVAEFHYLHHDKDGKPYSSLSEMGERLIAAAKRVGIRITLLPVFYQKGGFGASPTERQRRFISATTEKYLELYNATAKAIKNYSSANIGICFHSLRAVGSSEIKEVLGAITSTAPIHIHVAEQTKEVEDCIAFTGKRPVEWLLQNVKLNEHWNLVHATHLSEQEVGELTKSKANVVLCPSTEGNLGDGFFSMSAFAAAGGNWSIGTDSHIGLNPFEELRMIDYHERLQLRRRTTFHTNPSYLLSQAVISGWHAMGASRKDYFAVGDSFDALVVDAHAPLLSGTAHEHLLSSIIYSSDPSQYVGTIVNGRWIVKDHRHADQEAIRNQFLVAVRSLRSH